MYSADVLEANHPEEYEKDKFDVWIENKFGKEKAWKLLMILSVAIALILSVAIFMLFPTVITGLLSKVTDSVILLEPDRGNRASCHICHLYSADRKDGRHKDRISVSWR